MSPASVVERSDQRQSRWAQAGLWLRARVFTGRLKLDRALAGGADAAASRELVLRAEQLRHPRFRERTARGIDRLAKLGFDDQCQHIGPAMLPVRHGRVEPNAELFEELADALRGTGPHAVKGLAMASTLLEDPRGPLYANDPAEKLREALDATISELKVGEGNDQSDARPPRSSPAIERLKASPAVQGRLTGG